MQYLMQHNKSHQRNNAMIYYMTLFRINVNNEGEKVRILHIYIF